MRLANLSAGFFPEGLLVIHGQYLLISLFNIPLMVFLG
jgi:hypothetical protein